MSSQAKDWCILRTSGPRTLPLARSLGAAGFDVWTPLQTIVKRRPRSTETREIEAPILPTFVFARAGQLHDLARTLSLPMNPHPRFSIFQWGGRVPIISDRDIASLHVAEDRDRDRADRARRKATKVKPVEFAVGANVRVEKGPASGMMGVVERGHAKEPWVNFGGSRAMRIDAWLLISNEVGTHEAHMRNAA